MRGAGARLLVAADTRTTVVGTGVCVGAASGVLVGGRAGTTTTYHSGDAEADLARVAWYSANSKGATHPVGQKEPNIFALYDMHGNVFQWCEDWCGEDYENSEAENPQGPSKGWRRSLRGGCWDYERQFCRSAFRFRNRPENRYNCFGFRIVMESASP